MKARLVLLESVIVALAACSLPAQTPVLSSINAPYANLQNTVHMAGVQYSAGAVAYGPAGTPLELDGTNFDTSGTVLFPGTQSGTTIPANVSLWTSTTLFVTVPSGATTGMVTVTVAGGASNSLPFIVTQGEYSPSCPTYRPANQFEIMTTSLPDGQVGQSYSTSLNASGGTPPYTWSISGNALPAGLTLSPSGGTISGIPTSAVAARLTITAVDQKSQSTNVVLNLTVDPQNLPAATVYSYVVPQYDAVGNILQYQDSINGTWTFGFDTVNRLTSAVPGANAPGAYIGQSLCLAYDAFGNRTAQTLQSSACPAQESAMQSTLQYGTNNQIMGGLDTYDAAGNMTQDVNAGLNYLYDAEGRVCAVNNTKIPGMSAMTGYIYDPEGERVAKGTISTFSCDLSSNGFQPTEQYVLGPSGEELTTLDGSGNWQRTNVYGGGELLATIDQVPNPAYPGTQGAPAMIPALHYQVTDPLGTRRLQADSQGVPELDCQNLPYGDQLDCFADPNGTGSLDDSTPLHYTGKERDAETGEANGNDYFGARYYASGLGRFMSPDWSAQAQPVPYAKLDNPQTLNLYSYAGNNPLSNRDLNGHSISFAQYEASKESLGGSIDTPTLDEAAADAEQEYMSEVVGEGQSQPSAGAAGSTAAPVQQTGQAQQQSSSSQSTTDRNALAQTQYNNDVPIIAKQLGVSRDEVLDSVHIAYDDKGNAVVVGGHVNMTVDSGSDAQQALATRLGPGARGYNEDPSTGDGRGSEFSRLGGTPSVHLDHSLLHVDRFNAGAWGGLGVVPHFFYDHGCPVKSRTGSVVWKSAVTHLGNRISEVPVKWGFSRKG